MTFAFTTGLAALEAAVVAALQTALSGVAFAVETWEGDVADAFEAGRPMRLPAVLVSYQGGDFIPQGGDHYAHELQLHVLVLGRNRRGEGAARAPEATGEAPTGTYAIVQTVLATLTHNDLGLGGVDELQLVSLDPLHTGKGRDALGSAWLVVFKTTSDLRDQPPGDDLEGVDSTYSDADETEVATDIIDIEVEP